MSHDLWQARLGGDPAVGSQAALEDEEAIARTLKGADMVFVTAGLGGGSSDAAAAILAAPLVLQQPLVAQEKNQPDIATQLVVDAKASVSLADMAAFQQALEGGEYDLLIDVREPAEYAEGHIPGAVYADLDKDLSSPVGPEWD